MTTTIIPIGPYRTLSESLKSNLAIPSIFISIASGINQLWHVYIKKAETLKTKSYQLLAESWLKKDLDKFNRLYLPCFRGMTLFCLGYLKDRDMAENMASETLLKLLDQDKLSEIKNVDAWLFTIARNLCLTNLSKHSRRRDILVDVKTGMTTIQKANGEQLMREQDLKKLIATVLNEKELSIWNLHLQGFKNNEIAQQLQITEKTTANVKTIARNKLRSALKGSR